MANLCTHCRKRPQYRDGNKTHPYCGRTCAGLATASASNIAPSSSAFAPMNPPSFTPGAVNLGYSAQGQPGICRIPNCNKPVWKDPRTGKESPYCGNTCRKNATNITASLGPTACLQCHVRPCNFQFSESLFCGNGCKSQAEQSAPGILEIPAGHPKFANVAKQFSDTWRHTNLAAKAPAHIYFILVSPAEMQRYNSYKQAVEAKGNFKQRNRTPGNENRRWHGTTRKCSLGDPGNTELCQNTTCALCSIITSSFDLAFYKTKTSWGRFGCGIYTSATSSKSDAYSQNTYASPLKAMLLNKVVVGKGQIVNQDSPNLTAPSPGFDSVLGEPGSGGQLNFDECVVYTNDAIRPAYLVMY